MPQDFSRFTRSFAALVGALILAGCGGGGGTGGTPGTGGNTPPPPPGGGSTITVSGRVTFDRLQFQSISGAGLNATTPVVSPAREVVVQAVSGNAVSSSTTTDSNGNYSLSVPANSNVFIRLRAQMLKEGSAPTWNFTVKNNANSNAVYALDGDSFATGTSNLTRDLHAPSGWTGTGYNENGRFAAPFAILDTVYRTKQLILSAASTAVLPPLDLYWSSQNGTAVGTGGWPCPDTGDIGTSFYFSDPSNTQRDGCTNAALLPTGIYILGKYASDGDTDEFDAHVIAHEFGHYFEDRFSRSDSIGGRHGIGEKLDARLAFGEGWGNAFGAMALNDPLYRDSSNGISSDFALNLETGTTASEGWFSESSVGEILWDIFDTTAESGDTVTLGFAPIYAVMTDEQVSTNAFTSIFSFTSELRANNSGQSGAIGALLTREEISGDGEFGTGETNAGGDNGFGGVYRDIAVGQAAQTVCSTVSASGSEDGNKLGNRQFFRFVKSTDGAVSISANGTTSASVPGSGIAQDPDIVVYQRGAVRLSGLGTNPQVELIPATPLAAGTYVIEVYADEVVTTDPNKKVNTPRCMNISISGT